jgi:predicted nucleotidyltransferase
MPGTRGAVLSVLLLHPDRRWHRSGLAAHLGVPPSSLQRELAALAEAGILRSWVEGRHSYYQANPDCPVLPELQGLLVKTAGMVDVLRAALEPHAGRIRAAFVFGSIARGEELATSDVDLLVIGEVPVAELAGAFRAAEEKLGRAVDVTWYRPGEFEQERRSRFLGAALDGPKLFVLGSADELEEDAGAAQRGAAESDPRGDRRGA